MPDGSTKRERRRNFARTVGLILLVLGAMQLLTSNLAMGPDDYQGLHVYRVIFGMLGALAGVCFLAVASSMKKRP